MSTGITSGSDIVTTSNSDPVDVIGITVTCPQERAEDVARQIAGTHKLSTRFSDGSREFVAVGTKSGVHSMESISGASAPEYWTFDKGRDSRPHQDHALNASPGFGVDELQTVDDVPAASCCDERLAEQFRMMVRHTETLARVMHHMGDIASSWVDLASLHTSPSSVGSAPSVGDGAGPGDELRAHSSGPVGPEGGA